MNSPPAASVGIFAKYPEPGRVKTRLVPALGEAGAAQFARFLLLSTLQRLAPLASQHAYELVLWTDGGTADDWQRLLRALGPQLPPVSLHTQIQGHLGERMLHATTTQLKWRAPACLVGPDAVCLQAQHVLQLFAHLNTQQPLGFIPALDGGYVAIASQRVVPAVFGGHIAWGTATVAEQTRQTLAQLQTHAHWADPQPDVDEPADLEQAMQAGWVPNDWRQRYE